MSFGYGRVLLLGLLCVFSQPVLSGAAQRSFDIDVKELDHKPAPTKGENAPKVTKAKKKHRQQVERTESAEAPAAPAQGEYRRYTIKPGDHIFKILMSDFGMSNEKAEQLIPEILRINGIGNIRKLQVGQVLLIPSGSSKKAKAEVPSTETPAPIKADAPVEVLPKKKVEVPVAAQQNKKAEAAVEEQQKQKAQAPVESLEKKEVEVPVAAQQNKKAKAPVETQQKKKAEMPVEAQSKKGVEVAAPPLAALAPPPVPAPAPSTPSKVQAPVAPPADLPVVSAAPLVPAPIPAAPPAPATVSASPSAKPSLPVTPAAKPQAQAAQVPPVAPLPLAPSVISAGETSTVRQTAARRPMPSPPVPAIPLPAAAEPAQVPSRTASVPVVPQQNTWVCSVPEKDPRRIVDTLMNVLSLRWSSNRIVRSEEGAKTAFSILVDRYFELKGKRYIITIGETDAYHYTLLRLLEASGYKVLSLKGGEDFETVGGRLLKLLGISAPFGKHPLAGDEGEKSGFLIGEDEAGGRRLLLTGEAVSSRQRAVPAAGCAGN